MRILMKLCLVLMAKMSFAQPFVSIPDNNFRIFLQQNYPQCFDGNGLLNTACPATFSVSSLDCSGLGIADLTGIQHFTYLRDLDCSGNLLSALPGLSPSLIHLDCSHNLITHLPSLPSGLTELNCEHNLITSIPSLPGQLRELYCGNNFGLSCIPTLPSFLIVLDVKNTQLNCLPDIPNTFVSISPPNIPSCPFPANTCVATTFASGRVYLDTNLNGQYDQGERILEGIGISAASNGTSTVSNWHGFDIMLRENTTTPLSLSGVNTSAFTVFPQSYQLSSTIGQVAGSFDFGLQAIPNVKDWEISISHSDATPGGNVMVTASVRNLGSTTINDLDLTLVIPEDWSLYLAHSPNGRQVGRLFKWEGLTLDLFEKKALSVSFKAPISAIPSENFDFIAVSKAQGAATLRMASSTGSFLGQTNPNVLHVNRSSLPIGYNSDEELVYTINFQNTDIGYAQHAKIIDEISPLLDMSTLRIVNASHPFEVKVHGERHLEVFFQNIYLPDIAADPLLSKGFVQFKVKPMSGLATGTVIENSSRIYIGQSPIVYTNSVHTHIACFTMQLQAPANPEVCEGSQIQLTAQPNGGSGLYTYKWSTGEFSAQINPIVLLPSLYRVSVEDGTGCPTLVRESLVNALDAPDAAYSIFLDPNGMPAFTIYAINESDVSTNSCLWDFGDGNTSTDDYPTHFYANTGVYPLCLTLTNRSNGCTDRYCHNMGIDHNGNIFRQGFYLNIHPPSFTGVENQEAALSFTCSPNPNDGNFNLGFDLPSSTDIDMEVFDQMGRSVYGVSWPNVASGKSNMPLSIGWLPGGVYYLKIKAFGNSIVQQIVIR